MKDFDSNYRLPRFPGMAKLLLPLLLALTLSCAAQAQFTTSTNNNQITITGYSGPGGAVSIPATINGLPVASIGKGAFQNCLALTSVTISNSVTSIGSQAFEHCSALTSVTIPNGVTSIGSQAFAWCNSLTSIVMAAPNSFFSSVDGVLFNNSKTTLIQCPGGKTGNYIIPNSVTSIGDYAFEDCTGLTSLTIPNSVTTIGNFAFEDCTSLPSLTVPNSVTSIGGDAFEDCAGLTSMTIPNSVTTIGENAFMGCSDLTSITVATTNPAFSSVGGVLFNKDQTTLVEFTPGKTASYTIPNNTITIGAYAFDDCTSLASVTIPSSVTSIGESAFQGCTGLTSLTIPNSVITIGTSAFAACTRLTSVTIPNSVTTIGDDAFQVCMNLTSAVFTGTAPSMGQSVFQANASSFTVYYFDKATGFTSPTWNGYPAVVVGPPSLSHENATATVGTPFSYRITATAIATSYSATGLPSGVTCNAVTGLISGPPVNAGTFNVSLEASNPSGSGTGILTLVVQPAPLTAATGTVTSITATGAVLGGTVNPGGEAASYYFEYGLTSSFGSQTKTVSAGSGSMGEAVKATLTHLSPETTYCYRLIAVNTSGTACGETATFTTGGAPLADTGLAVASTARTLISGSANPDGLATSVYFQYGPAAATGTAITYSTKTPPQAAKATWEWSEFSATLTGLKPGTVYHYRIVATNSGGATPGSDEEFTTPETAPEIFASGTETGVTVTGTGESVAEVNAAVGPQSGAAASVYFQYGLTTAYGKKTGEAALTGGSACTASATLCGLAPHTVYHVRGVIQSAGKKSYSPDAAFTTLPRFDMNGDGHSDLLFWDSSTGETCLASLAAGSGTLAISGTQAGPILPAGETFCGEAEFNPAGDGYTIGWALTGATPAQTEFLTFESGSLSLSGTFPLVTGTFMAPAGSTIVAVADIDGDGNPDLILAGPNNTITFWLLNGFTVVAQKAGPKLPSNFVIAGVDDLGSNGKLDLLLWSPSTGETKILALNGTALASTTTGPVIPVAKGSQLVGVDLFTGTGNPNWLLNNPATEDTQIWIMQGAKNGSTLGGPVTPEGLTLLSTK